MNSHIDLFYLKIRQFLLPRDSLRRLGFPFINEETGTVNINQHYYFSSPDVEKQVCQCNKTLSLLEENWFLEDICQNNPFKCMYTDGMYQCCDRQPGEPDCVISPVQTFSYFSLDEDWFLFNPSSTGNIFHSIDNIFALKCEFVYTVSGVEVARVSLVCMGSGVVYDEFVLPENPIVDYNTRFSGVTPEDLTQQNVKLLHEVQYDLLQILNSDSILIGHALHSDLISLQFIHDKVIDTSVLFPHIKGFPYRNSLIDLADEHLGPIIDEEEFVHDSVEEAEICLELILLESGLSDEFYND